MPMPMPMSMPEIAKRTGDNSRGNEEFPDELPERHEIVRGILVRKAMPRFPHSDLQGELLVVLRSFHVRRGGMWRFASECEIEFDPAERYQPDLAGWRVDRVPDLPTDTRVRTPPQWVCEILSPSTAQRDLGDKRATYHAAHVDHYWLIDPGARTLAVLEWAEGEYRPRLTASAGERVHAPPFETLEIDLAELFG